MNTHVTLILYGWNMRKWLWYLFENLLSHAIQCFWWLSIRALPCLYCRYQISDVFTQKETRRVKITKEVTIEGHRSDRWQCRPFESNGRVTRPLCPGDPVRLYLLSGDLTPIARWPGTLFHGEWCFGIVGNEILDTFELTNYLCVLTKFEMSLTKFLIE
jgi:hypothetical protein